MTHSIKSLAQAVEGDEAVTLQLRLAEKARQYAQIDVENNRAPNLHGAPAGSFAALVYLTEYDLLTQREVKRAADGAQS